MTPAFVVGYDPGGNGKHGVAVLRVQLNGTRWHAAGLQVNRAQTLADAAAWMTDTCKSGRIVAVGVDTLTEWNSGHSGLRPADQWLRTEYREVMGGVIAPAGLFGAMVINGAGFLMLLGTRLRVDSAVITEAHPKVCYYACMGKRADWANDCDEMVAWLVGQLHVTEPEGIRAKEYHCFDAAMSALAPLRGLNRDWTRDLHTLPTDTRVQFIGQTHYWWSPSRNEDEKISGFEDEQYHTNEAYEAARERVRFTSAVRIAEIWSAGLVTRGLVARSWLPDRRCSPEPGTT